MVDIMYNKGKKTRKGNTMQCELCSHEVDEDEIEVLEIYNDYYSETDRFWACPDCVSEHESKSEKNQDTP